MIQYASWRSDIGVVVGVGALVGLFLMGWFRNWTASVLRRSRPSALHSFRSSSTDARRRAYQLKAYNRELIASNNRLQRLLKEHSTRLGVAAHDLKTPIMGIRALTDVLLANEKLSPDIERKVRLMNDAANEALTLAHDLLSDTSQQHTAALKHTPIDVSALCVWVVDGFDAQVACKRQQIHAELPGRPCLILGSKQRVREALNNLVSNAIKYSPHGATIAVSVRAQDTTVSVSVADEGPGLSADEQARLFRPFERLSPTPTGGEGSSGLGLYIVKQIADTHGATVHVDSAVGKGSTFTLTFPLYDGPSALPPGS